MAARLTYYFVRIIFLCFWATVCKTVRSMLSDRCLFVSGVGLLWPNGWMDQDGMEVGHRNDHIVLDRDPAPPPRKGHNPQFSVHVCCGQTARWIKIPLGVEVDLGPRDTV